MPVHVYECMLIFDSNRFSRDQAGVSGQIADFVTKRGGEMLASRLWEERRLAYPINGQRKGTYWLSYFKLDSSKVADVRHDCKLSDNILRALILKVDPRIADALVSHALTGQGSRPAPVDGEGKPEEKPKAAEGAPSETAEAAETT